MTLGETALEVCNVEKTALEVSQEEEHGQTCSGVQEGGGRQLQLKIRAGC